MLIVCFDESRIDQTEKFYSSQFDEFFKASWAASSPSSDYFCLWFVKHLVFCVCFFSPFSYLLTYIVNTDVISNLICPKWIKIDQTWSKWISRQSKNVTIKSRHIYKKDKNGCFIADFFGSDLSKMDQIWSNLLKLDFSPIKKCCYKKLSHLPWRKKSSLYFWSDWIRTVQNGSNLIKLESSPIKKMLT